MAVRAARAFNGSFLIPSWDHAQKSILDSREILEGVCLRKINVANANGRTTHLRKEPKNSAFFADSDGKTVSISAKMN